MTQELGEWVMEAEDDPPELAASRVSQLAHTSLPELTDPRVGRPFWCPS
jgi:hypothetical protein